jgi:hypothetical protein
MKLRLRSVLLAFLVLGMAACEESVTVPDVPTPPTINEPPFTGVLTINGAITQPFVTTSFGQVTVTLLALDPNPDLTVRISMALGTWNGTGCQIIIANDNAGLGAVIYGAATAAGPLCVRVSDAGKLTEPVAFEVTISHP